MSKAIVYCQLQHDLPRCFWTSLKKARELWAGDIYLIAPQRELGYTALKEYDVKFIAEHIIESDLLDQYERHTFFEKIHPGWDGFWDNACKRFIYLYELQRMENIDELLHFETDVVPYIDIENMFKNFGDAYRRKIVFSHHAPLQLSCCTIYCNAVEHFEVFCNAIIEYFKRGPGWFAEHYPSQTILNETHFAYTFQQEYGSTVELFPTMPGDKHAKDFGFLIDSTAWGMWVDGLHRDPGIKFATPNHTIGQLIIDCKYNVIWENRCPYVYDMHKDTMKLNPLATLHFNSKMPEKWI